MPITERSRVGVDAVALALPAAAVFLLLASSHATARPASALPALDAIASIVVLCLTYLARTGHGWARWCLGVVAAWLLLEPVVFAAGPEAAATDVVAAIAIAVGALALPYAGIEGSPSERPLGWTDNPSSWRHRAIVAVIAGLAACVAAYLAAFQLHDIAHVADPWTGSGSSQVLGSRLSRALPVSDAGLGAMIYAVEALATLIGDRRRWRTMPWIVLGSTLLIAGSVAVALLLVAVQALVVHAWCGWCLLLALLALALLALMSEEALAACHAVAEARRGGASWRSALRQGGGATAPAAGAPRRMAPVPLPWTIAVGAIIACAALALAADQRAGIGRDVGVIAAIVAAACLLLACGRPLRRLRWAAMPSAIWFVVGPWIWMSPLPVQLTACVLGIALATLAARPAPVGASFGSWDRLVGGDAVP